MDDDILDVTAWIQCAQEDYDAAIMLANANHPYSARKACYECQQSAEKILKAYMIAKESTRIKEHDPVILLKRCIPHSSDFGSLDANCWVLKAHITKSRYPSFKKLTDADMNAALQAAAQILEFTKAKLKEMGYEYLTEQDNRQTPP